MARTGREPMNHAHAHMHMGARHATHYTTGVDN